MKSLYCPNCGAYLEGGHGGLNDCDCGFVQPVGYLHLWQEGRRQIFSKNEKPPEMSLDALRDLKILPLYPSNPKNDELRKENEALRQENKRLATVEYCFNEWLEKTDWVQKTVQAHELGMHRADVLKNRIDALREVLKETLDFLEYNADYYPESGASDVATIAKIKEILGITTPQPRTATGLVMFKANGLMVARDPEGHIRVEMSALNNEGTT